MPTSTGRRAPRRSGWRSPTWAASVAGKKVEVHRCRPPEQGRRRRCEGARMVRHAGRRHAGRRHQLGHQPGDGEGRAGEEEALHLDRRGDLGADQRAVLAVHRALRLRHHGARQGHRQRGRQGRRQELVLPDCRLRVRLAAAERHHGGRQGGWRHGRRLGAPPAVGERLLVVPAAGAVEQGADPRPRQRRRRHDQHDQGGQRVRHHQVDEAGRPADVHQRRALARPEGDAGHVPDRQLVLEPRSPRRAPGAASSSRRSSACRRRSRPATTRPRCST